MADSENSRTLLAITRRNSLQAAEWLLSNNFSDQQRLLPRMRDGALTKWDAWNLAFQELGRLGREQQKLEGRLRSVAPEPQVEITRSDVMVSSLPSSITEIQNRQNGDACANAQASARATIDDDLGYRRAKQAEDDASLIEERLADELLQEPAITTVSVAAKLHCILERGSPHPHSDEYPWPHIRSVLVDILAMHGISRLDGCTAHPTNR